MAAVEGGYELWQGYASKGEFKPGELPKAERKAKDLAKGGKHIRLWKVVNNQLKKIGEWNA